MARKGEIKQFRQACKELGFSADERYMASEALHAEKETTGERKHMSSGAAGLAVTMEGALMSVTLEASPVNLLRLLRGSIVDAREGYPEVLHVEIRDSAGGLWRLATQDAEYSPSDPAKLVGQSVKDAKIDETTNELRLEFGGGLSFVVRPRRQEAADDPPNWELITPDGLALEFGPGVRWQIAGADTAGSPKS